MISRINHQLHKNIDASYTAKFLLRLFCLYLLFRFINWLWVGLITPQGHYSTFVDRYLDYVTIIRVSIMQTGKLIAQLFSVHSQLVGDYNLQVGNGGLLRMAWACCGLEIMSFWAAFVLADTTRFKIKFYWCLGGLVCIWLINCIRVAFLLAAKQNRWYDILNLDQHNLFNFVAYAFVLGLMFFYYKRNIKAFEDKKRHG
jgi:exosortase/archaeosortase family protein